MGRSYSAMKKKDSYKIFIIISGFMIIIFMFLLPRSKNIEHPNIIFITIDALRADHLGCYGYPRNTSPNIDALAREGVMFTRCFATGSATVYSFPSILTGRYLAVKKRDYARYNNILDDKFDTLAEYLKQAGYYTAAFINNTNLRINQGFEQGFDCYENIHDNAQEITAKTMDFLNNHQGEKPIFVWIHYLDPHIPYAPSPAYFKEFENDELYKENDRILSPNLMDKVDYESIYSSGGYIPLAAFQENKYNLNYYIASYDVEIRQTDFYMGKLLENIKDNTIVVLSADHGELLGEHNEYFCHGDNIYDELLHVPLIIKDSRYFKGGKKILTVVSSVDIVPTILKMIDPFWYFFNKNRFNGIDLLGILEGKNIKRKYIYSYFPYAWSIRGVKENIKYILNDTGCDELYFFPDEGTNYVKDNSPQIVKIRKELRMQLRKWFKRGYPIPADINSKKASLDQVTKDLLKNLGYLK
jgi:arylsulfatase A-like enzyme